MVGENFASPPTKEDEAAKQAYLDKISEQYSPYFTEKGYQNFDKPSYASRYHLLCDTQNYQMQVENIEMIPDNSTPPTYVTNVDLGFGAIEGLQHKIAVSFRIRCDEQGKIGYISLDDDSNQILFEELTK